MADLRHWAPCDLARNPINVKPADDRKFGAFGGFGVQMYKKFLGFVVEIFFKFEPGRDRFFEEIDYSPSRV